MKNIILHPSDQLSEFHTVLTKNCVAFIEKDFWNTQHNMHIIPEKFQNHKNTLYVIDYQLLDEYFNSDIGYSSLQNFSICNCVWVTGMMDASHNFVRMCKKYRKKLLACNIKNFTFFIDSNIDFTLFKVDSSIQIKQIPFNIHFKMIPELIPPVLDKKKSSSDFMLTMVVKRGRQHRVMLQEKLEADRLLTENAKIVVHNSHGYSRDTYVGNKPSNHMWWDNFPSMDLYSSSYFELVPETRDEFVHHFSEKTGKPIATCTPFLVVGTMGFLQSLQNTGFKTFSNYFNEDYDTIVDLSDRIDAVLNSLREIKKIGFEKVYNKTQPVLMHNFYHLQNLSGQYQFAIDNFYYKCCQEAGLVK